MDTRRIALLLALLLAAAAPGCATHPRRHGTEPPAATPAEVLGRLRAGNERFATGHPLDRDLVARRLATAGAQSPCAAVLGCIDSRCGPELVFDQGLGDLFAARVAGNVLDDDVLAGLEFACKVAGAKLVVVLGHSNCGAVKGACEGVELGHLTGLLAKLGPAVASVPAAANAPRPDRARIDAVAEANVRLVLASITERSPVLAQLAREDRIALVGAMYDLGTGRVRFLR